MYLLSIPGPRAGTRLLPSSPTGAPPPMSAEEADVTPPAELRPWDCPPCAAPTLDAVCAAWLAELARADAPPAAAPGPIPVLSPCMPTEPLTVWAFCVTVLPQAASIRTSPTADADRRRPVARWIMPAPRHP